MNLETVMRDLLSDPKLKNHQFFGFKQYKDERGVRLCVETIGSLSFQNAAHKIGPRVVPLSIVIYIDSSFV